MLLMLLVHLWVVRRSEVLSGHNRYLLVAVHAHANLHVVLVEGFLAVLLDFCSAILEPVLCAVSCMRSIGWLHTDVNLVERDP